MSFARIPDVARIAVLRANAVGDFVAALPALEALRATYPEARITLLGSAWHAEFLHDRPGPVDRVIALPAPVEAIAERGDEDFDGFFAALRDEHFDIALQLHGGGRHSNPLVRRLAPRLSAGLRSPDAAPLDRWLRYLAHQHEIPRYLETVGLVGATMQRLEPRLAVLPRDLAEARAVVPIEGPPLVVLQPATADPRRCWPTDRYAAVADALVAAGARVAINATAAERPVAQAVIARMRTPPIDLSGRLSLGGLLGLLSYARLALGNDSGTLHLAAAVGCATVGIYWCGNALAWAPLTRARHQPLIAWRVHCPECGAENVRERCPHQSSFVADITSDETIAAALSLLHETPETQPGGKVSAFVSRRASAAAEAWNEPPLAAALTAFHDRRLAAGKTAAAPEASDPLWGPIADNHRCNALLWNEEDQARRPDVADAEIAANKRAIDRYNQRRNDAVERIDEALLARFAAVPRAAGAWRSSETAGAMIDRLSILSLKIHHMRLQAERADAGAEHAAACRDKLGRLHAQRADLADSLDRLLDAARRGTGYFKVYRQFKMYNDPALNPCIYGAGR